MPGLNLPNHGSWLLYGLLWVFIIGELGAAPRINESARILVIGVDGIPYYLVQNLKKSGTGQKRYFHRMSGPIAVINSFPANSDIAWTGILEPFGIKKPNGYEARYYDHKRREIIGGTSLIEPHAPWKDFFDWRLKGVITGAVAYGWPKQYSVKEIRQGLAGFAKTKKRIYSFYVISTDAIGHINGPEEQTRFLKTLDQELNKFRQAHPDLQFHTIIISDHGMTGGKPLKNTWQAIDASVKQAGYKPSKKLEKSSDIIFIPYGLLSSFIVYTRNGEEDKVASAIVKARGIDLCVTNPGNGWRVWNRHGYAVIRQKQQAQERWWSYRVITSDPLNYTAVVRQLRLRAGMPKQVWFPDAWWFSATRFHTYPDALYRIYRSFDLVNNPASIVCSASPGYMFGALLTEVVAIPTIGKLRWTHGSLRRPSSYGFLLHDIPGWPKRDVVRFNQALAPLAQIKKRESADGR